MTKEEIKSILPGDIIVKFIDNFTISNIYLVKDITNKVVAENIPLGGPLFRISDKNLESEHTVLLYSRREIINKIIEAEKEVNSDFSIEFRSDEYYNKILEKIKREGN